MHGSSGVLGNKLEKLGHALIAAKILRLGDPDDFDTIKLFSDATQSGVGRRADFQQCAKTLKLA